MGTPRRRAAGLVALLLGLVLLAACGSTPSAAPTDVTTDVGRLHGTPDGGVVRYRGVPYAQPPVGAARWTPPRPVAPWPGVRDATRSSAPCLQAAGDFPAAITNEDCLTLDVTAPATAGANRPVLVFLHGGGLVTGAGSTYDPKRMAALGDAVVVTVEFRQGIDGFLSLPGMTGGGTFGFADQQEALRFVRRNAAAFGGDPRDVTLVGESGGAVSICAQLGSPSARGLFDKAIVQSAGSCGDPIAAEFVAPGSGSLPLFLPRPDAEKVGLGVAAQLGCPDPATALACLRRVPADKLVPVSASATFPAYGGNDALLPRSPVSAIGAGQVMPVPVLIGGNSDEARLLLNGALLSGQPPLTAAAFTDLMRRDHGARAAEVLRRYDPSGYESPDAAWVSVATDRAWSCPTQAIATALSARTRTYGYEFADRTAPLAYGTPAPGLPSSGAGHASDLSYLFDHVIPPNTPPGSVELPTPAQIDLGNRMIGVWTRFARTGDPGSPAWGAGQHVGAVFGEANPTADLSGRHRCDVWDDEVSAELRLPR